MRSFFEIIWSSLKMALQEFRSNKLRTFLSLFGVTIGIFCIISVLSAVGSLEAAIQKDIKSLGNKTVYIDKWDYTGQSGNPWWKYMKRPEPSHAEMVVLKEKVASASNVAMYLSINDRIEFEDVAITNVPYYGVTPEFFNIQQVDIIVGRPIQDADFDKSSNNLLIGYAVAEKLFGKADAAVGNSIRLKNGKQGNIIGLIKKQGQSMIGGWDFDNCIIMPHGFFKQINPERYSNPVILVQAREDLPMAMLLDELTGAMRSLRKLKPREENDFSLNDIDAFSNFAADIFSGVNKGGWAIAALSLLVGMFGVANIMFVTVRERTSQIGLKKAIGAKKSTILMEFLLEAAFLCILGGMIGLALVVLLAKIASAAVGFPIFVSLDIMFLAVSICIIVGVVAGIVPASVAAKMNPVVAIRTK